MADESTLVRRRVVQACDSCRALKSRCDGNRPVCNRCKGYGHTCQWKGRPRRSAARQSSQHPDRAVNFHHALQRSHNLLRLFRDKLSRDDQELIDVALSEVNETTAETPTGASASPTNLLASTTPHAPSGPSPRYLGEVSDVFFFNSVKSLLVGGTNGHKDDARVESYERGSLDQPVNPEDDGALRLPDRELADDLVDIYFSTIHVAYPFLCKQRFMKDYHSFWESASHDQASPIFRSLLLTIYSIGSYYRICSRSTADAVDTTHAVYFRTALLDACKHGMEHSMESICLLLTQCFYLLATCQTDRCWMTLGFAIRMGQSMGLHVERVSPTGSSVDDVSLEFRRRAWHSAYVLDRLLSLQLGRPSAIRNRDCNVRLPSRLEDEYFDLERGEIPVAQDEIPHFGDYSIEVVRFSRIVGHVLRDLYTQHMTDYSEEMFGSTATLDNELLDWRCRLPRWLRFDRGHTLERSTLFRRQRNMLAMKFHHLRALIHRRYLCLPWLIRDDGNIATLLQTSSHRVVQLESICVSEAQETAHMLHDVIDQKSLVEDFPWWQMISCLICASSILLVMKTFSPSVTSKDIERSEILEEDAETCLKVFDALSSHSDAARAAGDMLRRLRDINVQDPSLSAQHTAHPGDEGPGKLSSESYNQPTNRIEFEVDSVPSASSGSRIMESTDMTSEDLFWQWQQWPSEMADSMAWSSRFLDGISS